ncbi:MAG: hypothetical protein JSV65_12395 [Armatimonadota bacterium]|nr:MAG: hypothetical protein JSV65_12395 [Armatimonadota bacterium]
MGVTDARRTRQRARPFPLDAEVRSALIQSGMTAFAVGWAMSQLLRLLRWDFGGRRKRRLHNLALERMGMVQLKEKLADIVTRHERDTGSPVSMDDLSLGNYQEMLVDFGATAIDRALNELVREGIVRREKRGFVDVIRPTGKPYHTRTLAALRQVLDRMKLDLDVRYATQYDTGRTYNV